MIFSRAILVAILLTGTGFVALGRQTPAGAQSPIAYVALGDSIAYGIGSSLPERRGYPPQVRDYMESATGDEVTLLNLAVPGETAASFMTSGQVDQLAETRRRLDEQDIPIALVTVSLGGNEMLAQRYSGVVDRQQALGDFRDTLDAAVGRIREEVGASPQLILTTYYDLSEGNPEAQSSDAWWIEQFNEVIRETAERHGGEVADLNTAFRGHINDFTLHPYDIHPKNQGYRAIASQVFAALGWDSNAPEIHVLSGTTATRRTPTLQLKVTDDVGVKSVRVRIDDRDPQEAVDMGDGMYVMLLDLRNNNADEYLLEITATDVVGNEEQIDVQLAVQSKQEG